ncbi:MAG TPA: hypothetical protein ENN31_00640 [Candidatus Vogelbacteria bacterium]|nr:hypothetical protein [Candidatus Vogelbacteria bacterium]
MKKTAEVLAGFVGITGMFFLLGLIIVWTDPQVEVLKVQNIDGPAEVVSVKVIEDGQQVEKRPEWLESYNGSYHTTWVSPSYRPSFLTEEEMGKLEAEKLKAELEEAEALGQSVTGRRLTITGWVLEDNES